MINTPIEPAVNKKKRWTRHSVGQVYDALVKAGTIAGASALLKCSRNTVSKHLRDNPDLEKAFIESTNVTLDIAETALMKNVKNGHPSSIFFFLKTKGKHRGYVERSESTGKNGGPIEYLEKTGNTKARDTIDKLIKESNNVTKIHEHVKKPLRPTGEPVVSIN